MAVAACLPSPLPLGTGPHRVLDSGAAWCPQRQAPFPDGHLALNLRPRNEWALPTRKSQDPQFTPAASPWRLWATRDPQLRAGSVCTPPSHHSSSWGFQTTPQRTVHSQGPREHTRHLYRPQNYLNRRCAEPPSRCPPLRRDTTRRPGTSTHLS